MDADGPYTHVYCARDDRILQHLAICLICYPDRSKSPYWIHAFILNLVFQKVNNCTLIQLHFNVCTLYLSLSFLYLFVVADESQSIHFEGVLRQSEWQSKVIRNSTKSVIKGALAMQKATEREDRIKKNSDSSINSRKLSNKKLGLVATSKCSFNNLI